MVTVDEYGRVRRAHRDGLGIRALAKRFRHSRRKVREILATPEPKPYLRLNPLPSILDPYKAIIDGTLQADEESPRKQRHTGNRKRCPMSATTSANPATNTLLVKANLKQLRLPAMHAEFEKLAREAATANENYEQYLLRLTELEVAARSANVLQARIKQAAFPVHKDFDTYDFSAMPALSKPKLLELARGRTTGVTDALSKTTTYTLNALDETTKSEDASGIIDNAIVNALNRPTTGQCA